MGKLHQNNTQHAHSYIHTSCIATEFRNGKSTVWIIGFYSISITEMQTTNGINSQLSITHSDRQDSGVYKCVAENPFGKSEYIIYVAVQGMYRICINFVCALCFTFYLSTITEMNCNVLNCAVCTAERIINCIIA